MLKTKAKNLRDRTADAILATLKARKHKADPVITDGVACYYDSASGFLLIVPLDETGAEPVPKTPVRSNEDAHG